MTPLEIGRLISQARMAAGMTQAELAREVKIARQTLSTIECGKVKKADALLIEKIARACGVTKFKLLGSRVTPKEWSAPEMHDKLEALLETRSDLAHAVSVVIAVFYDRLRSQKKLTD